MKRMFGALFIGMLLSIAVPAQAAETGMYVGGNYVQREFTTIGNFDMVPILDIAGELGYSCTYDGNQFWLYNDAVSFVFTMGSPDVYSNDGTWFGLDIVPQVINGRVMIPANFIIYNLGVSYTWDDLTKTLFIASDDTYRWLISTPEYQEAKMNKPTWDAVQGWWKYEEGFEFYSNIYFSPDDRAYLITPKDVFYGTYRVTAPNIVEVQYGSYAWINDLERVQIDPFTVRYQVDESTLTDLNASSQWDLVTYERGRSDWNIESLN